MRNIAISIIIGLFCLVAVGNVTAADKNIAVTDVQGSAEVLSQNSTAWAPVTFGMMLSAGDTVKTGADSYVDLSFKGTGNDAVVRVDPNSNLKIAEYAPSPKMEDKKIMLELALGDVFVKANKLKNESQFQVRTPTSIVGVRGTGFKVSVSAENN